jgi:hypothetical protein
MNVKGLSENGLKMLHNALRDAFEEDEGLPSHAKKYGVREFADWKAWGDTLEAELKDRGVHFIAVPWNVPPLPKTPARVFYYGKSGPYGAYPVPGEVYVIQHFQRGPFFVETVPTTGGPAAQLGGPFPDVASAQQKAARH